MLAGFADTCRKGVSRTVETTVATAPKRAPRWLPWAGALLGLAALAWLMRGFDCERFRIAVADADPGLVMLVPLAVRVE